MMKRVYILSRLLCLTLVLSGLTAIAQTGIVGTKHDLSKGNPNPLVTIKSTMEDRICVFCHTPHNAAPQTPLWNKNLNAVNYTPYISTTMLAAPSQPTGPSRLCLSCHDGTIALGNVIQPAGGIAMTVPGGMPSGPSNIGSQLEGDHPFSFSYFNSLPNTELNPSPLQTGLLFYGNGVMHCSTCHDPHENTNKKFLARNNENSGLCTLCHTKDGWTSTPHSTDESTWNGTAPNPWPRTGFGTDFGWTTVKKNGCENCHAPHNAVGKMRLLNCYTETGSCVPATEEGVCYPCHNGHLNPPTKDIFKQLTNTSRHTVDLYNNVHDPTETPRMVNIHVECVDCHNPHKTNHDATATAPAVSGRLDGVSGIAIDDTVVKPAVNEYEICFKCHASPSAQSIFLPIPRVIETYNTRMEFQAGNPSFHPVAFAGGSSYVPSLNLAILPNGTSSMIYCTDCHSDESEANGGSGSRGPHGSTYAPILREQYKTDNNNVAYNSGNFALCYRCHNESSILSDNTFRKNSLLKGGHSGHLGYPSYASCSACHDPHGIPDNGTSGSHRRLMNFDTRIVSALPGFSVPIFAGLGNGSGNCALVCHDSIGNPVTHDGSAKYAYGGYAEIGIGDIHIGW